MAPTAPIIQAGILTYSRDKQTAKLAVDTSEWYAWLETASTFTFRSEHGSFTACLEQAGNKRGGQYWRAYRKRNGKLHRAYLGKSQELTLERLKVVAAVLAGLVPAQDAAQANAHEPEAAPLQILGEPQHGQHRFLPTLTTPSPYPDEPEQWGGSRDDLPAGTITLLFTDIEGSTRLLQQLGDRYAEVLTACRHLLRTVFQEHHGHEVDRQGDAFFVVFTRASDAVSAAVATQRAFASRAFPEGVMVRVRMGLHTGEPECIAEGYVGLDVHHAARIMSSGYGGQILLSQTTRDLVEHGLPDRVTLRDLGEHRLKDLQRPSHLYQLVIADLPADFPPLKTIENCPNNLPVQFTPLIGREQEVAAVQHLLQLEHVRLVTLTGPGGTGKTRLGLQVAAELSDLFTDGVYFVNLAPLSDPEFVVPTIAQTLGLREVAGQPFLEHLKRELQQKQLLLVLDNFEQVVSAAHQLVDLLATCSRLKLLVTSREVLRVRAEREFAVPPLALPDLTHLPELAELLHYTAVTLFIERAQAVKSDFQVTDANARAVAETCVRLDGLPLALELAAARVKLFPPQALLAQLEQRLQVLTRGARDAPVRQQSLRNTLAWSYELLTAEEQRLFRRLSVFVGGCTLQAIEALCAALEKSNGVGRVVDGVASLIDKSLLQQTEQEENEPRLVMLETIREYGLEVLTASGEMETTRQAHALYYLTLAEEAEPELRGPQQVVWLERLEREHDNLRAVLQWFLERGEVGDNIEMALRLAGALWWFWEFRDHWSEGWNFLERALAGSKGVAVPVQVKALKAAANLAFVQSDTDRAEALYEECLARCWEVGDTAGIALSLRRLGAIAARRGNWGGASSLTEESLALFRKVGDKQGIALALNNLASYIGEQGEYARAISLLEEALALFREVGDKEFIAWVLIHLANMLFLSKGDPAKVHALLEEGLALCRELSSQEDTAWALSHLGEVFLKQGNAVKARSLLEESVALSREIGYWYGTAKLLSLLGRVEALERDYAAARTLYEECLAIARVLGDRLSTPFYLEGLADVVASQGDPVWAARLWGTAEALREAMGTPLPPVYRADYERAVAAARTQLGEKFFVTAWVQGHNMTLEQALAAQTAVRGSISAEPLSTPPAKSPPTYPAGLTAREVEVLRLLATGLTDAQIAEHLVISPRTVNNHLTSIYSKIQVSSRAAATRSAMEHQLV